MEAVSIGDKIDCSYNLAYATQSHLNGVPPGSAGKQIWQIQICPWYLKIAASQRDPPVTTDLNESIWTKIMSKIGPLIADKKYSPVDLLSGLEKVLLHEITHTVFGGETIDVGGFSGYGWKNCRKLSTTGSGTNGPLNNAGKSEPFIRGSFPLFFI